MSHNNQIINSLYKSTYLVGSDTWNKLGVTNFINDKPEDDTVEEKINLWKFIRLYTISGIPLIDIIIVYVILYIINSLYCGYNYKFVLILTVPITILFNMLTNKKFKLSIFILIVLIISIYYLLTSHFDQNFV